MVTVGHVASGFAGACAMSVSTLFFHVLTSRAEWGWIVDVPDDVNFTCREGNQIGCDWLDLACNATDPDNYKCTLASDVGLTCNVLELRCKSCDDDEPLALKNIRPKCLSHPGTDYYLEWSSSPSCDFTPPAIPNSCPITTTSSTTAITMSSTTASTVSGSIIAAQACRDIEDGATNLFKESCSGYDGRPARCGYYDDIDFSSTSMCCGCGGGSQQVYVRIEQGCVIGHHIVKHSGKTVAECEILCDQHGPACLGFQYGVAYGGGGHNVPGDCQLQSSAQYPGCDGAHHNLDLYIKQGFLCEQPPVTATDQDWDGCEAYQLHPSDCGCCDDADFTSNLLCCHCGAATTGLRYWLDDGCPSEIDVTLDNVDGYFADPITFAAAARCCSFDGATCTTPESCPQFKTFKQASQLCTDQGRRLCTKSELLSGKCCGTGGNCDNVLVWTSTRQERCESTSDTAKDQDGDGCEAYYWSPSDCGCCDDDDFSSNLMCCDCGGGREDMCGSVQDWADRFGNTCEDYGANDLCTLSGGPGPNWNFDAWGTSFDDASFGEQTATTACCECGGGSVLAFCDSTNDFSSTYPCVCGPLSEICYTNQICRQYRCEVAHEFHVSRWPSGSHVFGSRTFRRDTTSLSETPVYFNGDGIWIHHVPNCSENAVGDLVIGPSWVVAIGKTGGFGRCSHLASVKSRSRTGPPSGTNAWRVLRNDGWKDMEVTIRSGQEAQCFQTGYKFTPGNMQGQGRTVENSPEDCQSRCASVTGCAHFNWWADDEGCHLQDNEATKVAAQGVTTGPPLCQGHDPEVSGALPMSAVVAAFLMLMCTFVG